MSLTERMRTIAADVREGDTTGSLRDELETLRNEMADTITKIQEDVRSLQERVEKLGN